MPSRPLPHIIAITIVIILKVLLQLPASRKDSWATCGPINSYRVACSLLGQQRDSAVVTGLARSASPFLILSDIAIISIECLF